MKLITKIIPQRKKYEKISKTHKNEKHKNIENIDWGEGRLEKAPSYPNPNTPKTRKMPGLTALYYYSLDQLYPTEMRYWGKNCATIFIRTVH